MKTCQVKGCSNPVFVKARGWCRKHYHRWWRTGDPLQAAYERTSGIDRWQHKYRVDAAGCWIWTGSLDKHGYGQYDVRVDGQRKNWRAHRWVWTQLVGDLDDDATLDHLCRVHACVNPEHLEPVTVAENISRGEAGLHNAVKTHCAQGHEFTPENTWIRNGTWRSCRACSRASSKAANRSRRGTPEDFVLNADKTHCTNGHEFTPENTRLPKRGGRECITCQRARMREYMRKRRAAST